MFSSSFLILFIVLLVAWVLGSLVFHVAGGLIHLLLVIAVISLIVHFVRGRPRAIGCPASAGAGRLRPSEGRYQPQASLGRVGLWRRFSVPTFARGPQPWHPVPGDPRMRCRLKR